MQNLPDEYRGHAVFSHASGPACGPWVPGFSVWKIEPNNCYIAILQGVLSEAFESPESARAAAVTEAKYRIDSLLDKK